MSILNALTPVDVIVTAGFLVALGVLCLAIRSLSAKPAREIPPPPTCGCGRPGLCAGVVSNATLAEFEKDLAGHPYVSWDHCMWCYAAFERTNNEVQP